MGCGLVCLMWKDAFCCGTFGWGWLSKLVRTHSSLDAHLKAGNTGEKGCFMFEDSLFASQDRIASKSVRWTSIVSVGLQLVVVALLIVVPMLRPEALALKHQAPPVFMTLQPKPIVKVERVETAKSAIATTTPAVTKAFEAPPSIPTNIAMNDPAPSTQPVGRGMATGESIASVIGVGPSVEGPRVSVAPPAAKPQRVPVSSGVIAGLLLTPFHPVYPAIAKATHTEGTVIVEAMISKTGTIEGLRVVSGPEMLRRAALDAIQGAQYQPYKLNGEATEVATTITVNFRMGS